MQPHLRALIAASAFALVTGRKVAGLYDHTGGRHLRIAAEAHGGHLQGYDGDRDARFGGTLPDIRDAAAGDTAIHIEITGTTVRAYDRGSASHVTAEVTEAAVQLYDHAQGQWHAFSLQVA